MDTPRIWLLRLVLPGRFGRPLTGLLLLFLLLGWFWLSGVFDPTNEEEVSPAAAVFFCVIIAYIVPVFHFIIEQTHRAYDQITPRLDLDESTILRWRRSIAGKNWRWVWTNLGVGIAAWLVHTSLLFGSPGAVLSVFTENAAYVAFLLGPGLVWVSMFCVIGVLVSNARLFRALASHVRIDLLDPAPLTAFARVAVISTLALVGAQAAFPILWLDARQAILASVPGLLATGGAMVLLFVLPIWPIHRALAAAKRAELGRVGAMLSDVRATLERDGATPSERMVRLGPYLVYRGEISSLSEWPFDSSIATRLGFYLIIPPLTWLGAALIEVMVERSL